MEMDLPHGGDGQLALALVSTIGHDGAGGISDDFETSGGVARWISEYCPGLAPKGLELGLPDTVRAIRQAARALFAMTVRPAPPSRADAKRLMPDGEAVALLTGAVAALEPTYTYGVEGNRVFTDRATDLTRADVVIPGLLAISVLDFLAGPNVTELRSCQAPRCVRYFLKHHGRQTWCKESCGNRARVARHAARN